MLTRKQKTDKLRNIIKGYYKIEKNKRQEVIDEIGINPYTEILRCDFEDLENIAENFLKLDLDKIYKKLKNA